MCQRMAHRGPDDQGFYIDEPSGTALGARRLSIIDVAGGHQPVSNEDGSVWAVLNGEIYNHPLLQRALEAHGHQLKSRTDTEVLVHLYEDYGDALVHALEGMYAFAIYDVGRRRLLLGRDRFGEKPLFFAEHEGALTFASELTALAAGAERELRLDPLAIDDFFVLGYFPGETTIASGVCQLLPGHTLTWSAEDPVARTKPYWGVPKRPTSDPRPREQLVDELEVLLRGAVRSRLIADVPVGVFLSGGLDSTLVTTLAAEEASGRLTSFTVSYDVGAVNEDVQARKAAERIGTEHAEIVIEQSGIESRLSHALGSIDQPSADPALVALHAVAELARSRVTVAVGGEGSDELFGGYPRYRWLQRSAVVDHLPSMIRSTIASAAPASGQLGRVRRVADLVADQSVVAKHLDWVTDGRRHAREDLYGPRLRSPSSRVLDDAQEIFGWEVNGSVASRLMELDQRRWLPDDVLFKADRASMLNSLEVRTPFLDRALAEFAASVPADTHLKHGGKALLRAVHRRVAPAGVEIPPKTAFRVPVAEWLRGPLRQLLLHHATEGRLVTDGWFDRQELLARIDRHHGGTDESAVLWPAFALGVWLEGAGRGFAS